MLRKLKDEKKLESDERWLSIYFKKSGVREGSLGR